MAHNARRVTNAFGQVCNVVERAFLDAALHTDSCDLTPTQYAGLRFVARHPRACIRDLATSLHVSHPAAVKLVERLSNGDLVDRSVCPEDHRRVCLTLSHRGRQLSGEVRLRQEEMVARALERLGPEESERLERLLTEFVAAAVENVDQISRVCLFCGVEHSETCPVSEAEESITGKPRAEY